MVFYSIFYNQTLAPTTFLVMPAFPKETMPGMLNLKVSIDNGIIDWLSREQAVEDTPVIEPTVSSFPLPPDRFIKDVNLVS